MRSWYACCFLWVIQSGLKVGDTRAAPLNPPSFVANFLSTVARELLGGDLLCSPYSAVIWDRLRLPRGQLTGLTACSIASSARTAGSLNQAWSGMPVAMWEDDDHIFIEAELPGVSNQDVDITIHHGMLSIRGERKPEEGRRYLYNGRPYGRFERVMTLPEAVQSRDVQATMKDGILSLILPKSPEAKPKKITIREI